MSFETLLKEIPKKLMGYAMVLAKNNEDDAWDLIQTTVLKLIEKKKVFMKVKYKTSFTKVILRNAFIDKYRKDKRMVSIEENSIQLIEPGKLEEARESDEMLTFLESMDGEVLHQENLGSQVAGLIGFDWKDLPPEMVKSKDKVTEKNFSN